MVAIVEIWFNHHPFGDDDYLKLCLTIILLVIGNFIVDLTIILLVSVIFAVMISPSYFYQWWSFQVVRSYYHPFGDSKLFCWSHCHPFGSSDLCHYNHRHPFVDGDLCKLDLTIILLVIASYFINLTVILLVSIIFVVIIIIILLSMTVFVSC